MKSHVPIIVAAGAVVIGLVLSLFTASWLEDPQERSYRLIDEQVDLAQRMLAGYEPLGTRLSQALGASATQPADVPDEQWQAILSSVERDSVISDSLQEQRTRIRTLAGEYSQLEGSAPPSPRRPGSGEAYRQLSADLEQNEQQIAGALQIVQAAIRDNLDGANHLSATRLEAILCYHQADLKRRQAALQRTVADEARIAFTHHAGLWRELDASMRSLDDELRQPSATTTKPVVATAPGEPVVEQAPGPTTTPDKPAQAGEVGPESEAAIAQDEPADTDTPVKTAPPSLAARVAKLEPRQEEVAADSQAAREQARRLTKTIADLEQRIAAARAQAHAAEQRMFELEEAGVDPSDPESLKQFIEAYNAASAANRIAFRESTILQQGALRNARADTSNEDEMLTMPLVPADPDRAMAPERGLVALQSDLQAAQALVETRAVVAQEIDRQIEELSLRRTELGDRQTRLRAEQAASAEQAARAARVAIAAVIEADSLENGAITLAQGPGLKAVQRAQAAAAKRISDARTRNAENSPESPNPRLVLITRDVFTTGHAIIIAGDLHHVTAQTYAQRANGCQHHSRMLGELASIGMPDTGSLLPEGLTPESAPASAIQSEAAKAASEEARTAGAQAARLALEEYDQADEPLRQLWVLHANMGAVHYLLANLTSGPEAQEHRDAARQEYRRALHNRDDRPEAPIYDNILAGLAETGD